MINGGGSLKIEFRDKDLACDLDQPYRLIIKGSEPNNVIIWAEVIETEVLEIVDYHK